LARSRCEGIECVLSPECVLYEADNGLKIIDETSVCIHLCSCVCARARVCACVCMRMRVYVCACVLLCLREKVRTSVYRAWPNRHNVPTIHDN
jgi:hypothetical protein